MFCTNCGAQLAEDASFCMNCGEKVDCGEGSPQKESNGLQMAQTDNLDKVRQIIGENADYYLEQFGKIQQSGESKMNWAAFFLGLFHASYRNMWRKWLKAICTPMIVSLAAMLVGMIFIWTHPILGLVGMGVGGIAGIGELIVQIMYAKGFNKAYMQRVEQKLMDNDFQPDTSFIRAVIACAAATVVGVAAGGLVLNSTLAEPGYSMSDRKSDSDDDWASDTNDETGAFGVGYENVLAVKEGSFYLYPDKKIGEAFDSFFGTPTWQYFVGTKEGPDNDGDGRADYIEENVEIVEFTGHCMYQDVDVKALIQFTLDGENAEFRPTYLSFNDVPQNNLMLYILLESVLGDGEAETGESDLYEELWVLAGEYEGNTMPESVMTINIYSSPEEDNVGNYDITIPKAGLEYSGELYQISDNEFSLVLYDGEFMAYIEVVDWTQGSVIIQYAESDFECTYFMYEAYPLP